jgi:hypothetical protein
MIAGPNLDVNILKHLKRGTVVSATRIEPPLHPPGPEKITQDWGNEVNEINFDAVINSISQFEIQNKDKTTEGIFAPWCMYKEDFLAIGGHDELFAPQSKEDSDLFNRFVLNGYEVIQSWDGLVYHFTSRGSRFNKHAGGSAGVNSEEWLYTTNKNARNFIRKWGHFVKHDSLMKPIIPPKYNIAFVVQNGNLQILEALEPWCDRIYVNEVFKVIGRMWDYVELEQENTSFDLSKRVVTIENNDPLGENDIVVEIDGYNFTQGDFNTIQQLSEIIKDSGEPGTFTIGNLKITIYSMTEYQNDLIHI